MSVYIFKVVDANDVPITDAFVGFDGVFRPVGLDGTCLIGMGQGHVITVQAPSYIKETINFQGAVDSTEWDNPLLWRTSVNDRIELTVHLGRLEVVRTTQLTQPEIDAAGAIRGDLRGCLLGDLPATPGHVYHAQRLPAAKAEFVDSPLLPEPGPAPGAIGWDAFNSHNADPPVDPSVKGRFFYLLHRGAAGGRVENRKRYCVAVWSPDISQVNTVSAVDMIVFFSPSTLIKGFESTPYPFGAFQAKANVPGTQPYMDLATRYMLSQFAFIYQLLAQRKNGKDRNAVIVMPLSPSGSWGPYASGEGIFRLCREVAVFLHREGRTGNSRALRGPDQSPNRVRDEEWFSGGSLRNQNFGIFGSNAGLPPKPGRIVLSGFSAGISVVKTIMTRWSLPVPPKAREPPFFEQRHWGCLKDPGEGSEQPEATWRRAWRELWDLDGQHSADSGSWENYMDKLNGWVFPKDAVDPRMIRLLHHFRSTQDPNLYPPNPEPSRHALWKKLIDEGIPQRHSSLREVQGGRWTVIALKSGYFVCKGGVIPFGTTAFRDAHHAAGQVAFTHFLALSPVGLSP
jgi:hypothetical protein